MSFRSDLSHSPSEAEGEAPRKHMLRRAARLSPIECAHASHAIDAWTLVGAARMVVMPNIDWRSCA